MGPQRLERARGLAPVSRAQHHCLIASSIAPHQCACCILPYYSTLAVLQPCLKRTPALLWQSREERVCPSSMGPLHTERARGLAPVS